MRQYLDNDWFFTEVFDEKLLTKGIDNGMKPVRIPHTVKETALHYFDEKEYQMISGYKRILSVPAEWKGKSVLLTFEGVAHDAILYINGKEAGCHHSGYTAFTIDVSDIINYGEENEITVRCDSNETLNTPPFGFVIDYMTYGGIYRDVYIDVKEKTHIEDIFIYTRLAEKYTEEEEFGHPVRYCRKSNAVSRIRLAGQVPEAKYEVRQSIRKKAEPQEEFAEMATKPYAEEISFYSGSVELWDIDNPVLYELRTDLIQDGKVIDQRTDTIGFRQAVFRMEGFYLNGRKVKIRGLNRHQSYPYVGYAMPESMQKWDADILKKELGLNAVRTSHYPQSQHFINRCDELGLLVFTEFPGWQHIGDSEWKEQAVTNLREMIEQYRNHPSIILWGVRINESVDDDEFYMKTNSLAHLLDPSRQTGGVRCYKKGSFLEDVYTYNDFSHIGTNKGVDKKADVTSEMRKPYLVSEYNGHMYPTKAFDWEEHRMEHMLRHANVLDEVMHQPDICGSFGWCMFDYNTHKDFGSGDRICYHGVMDMFRNPKLASFVYSSEGSREPVLELSSSMDIGEHPGSNRGKIYILTNLDSVKMYKNGTFLKEYFPKDSSYKNLSHGPIRIDDYVGSALIDNEKMSKKQAEDVKQILNATAEDGLYNMSKVMWLKAGKLMLRYGMKMEEAVKLYNKYIGDWGGSSKNYVFEGYKNGELVKTLIAGTVSEKKLWAEADHTALKEEYTYDVAEVRIRMHDENGRILPYYNDPITLTAEGPIEIIGPSIAGMSGGMCGTYVKTTGEKGKAKLSIETTDGLRKEVEFTCE
ncbi:MAG: glycoside hydrolase family 2 protein [Eubacterium sp.]|nr:glycoside hydrolase family 2 protein [Eubacterium sp.]